MLQIKVDSVEKTGGQLRYTVFLKNEYPYSVSGYLFFPGYENSGKFELGPQKQKKMVIKSPSLDESLMPEIKITHPLVQG